MKFLENLGLAVLAVFAPVKAIMLTVMSLVFMDMITGILASRKQGKKITSSGFKRTVAKILMYEIAVIAAYFVQAHLTGELFPASKLLSALIGLTELKSILENLDIINGNSTFKVLLDKIVKSEKDLKKDE